MWWYQAFRTWCSSHSDWALALGLVVGLRLWFALWGAGIILVHGTPIVPNPPTMYHEITRVPDEGWSLVLAPWQRWDEIWYERIASLGYAPDDASPSFFPLFPILSRGVVLILANNYLAAELVVSTLATCGAFVLLYRLTAELVDETTARHVVVYWAVFPTSFYLFGGYAESVLALCTLASLYWARHMRGWRAAFASAGATLARPVGFLIAVPLVIEAWNAGSTLRVRARALIPLVGVMIGLGAWMLYLQIAFGDALLWMHAEGTWQRVFVIPGQTVLWTAQNILSGQGAVANNIIDFGLTVILFVAILAGFRKIPFAFSAYALMMLIVPLLNYAQVGTYALAPMAAAGRRAMVVLPAFVALACSWRGKWRTSLWVIISLTLQVILFLAYVLWLWVD